MKKLMFTALSILIVWLCMPITSNAQSSKIEDFFKKYSSQKGASYVEMSKAILDAAFKNKNTTITTSYSGSNSSQSSTSQSSSAKSDSEKYPQKFKSLVLNETSKANELNQLLKGKDYEVLMETKSDKEDRKTKESYALSTTYYLYNASKANEKEIIIVQQEGDNRLSVTYIQGDLDINKLQRYLYRIRNKLSMMDVESGLTSDLGTHFNFDMNDFQFGNDLTTDTGKFMFTWDYNKQQAHN